MNATQQVILTTSVFAATALTQRRFAGIDGKVCADGTQALGVVEVGTGVGNMAPVNVLGIILVEAAGVIAAGADVQSDASGCAVTRDKGVSNGIALDTAAIAGDVIRIVRGL